MTVFIAVSIWVFCAGLALGLSDPPKKGNASLYLWGSLLLAPIVLGCAIGEHIRKSRRSADPPVDI